MLPDELHVPLGRPAATQRSAGRVLSLKALSTLGVCIFSVTAAAWIWAHDDGLGGRPRVIVDIKPAAPKRTAASEPTDTNPTGTIATPADTPNRRSGEEVETSSGVRVFRAGEPNGAAPGALIIRVPDTPPSIALAPAPDRQLVEKGAHGLLPKIGNDGRRPVDAYARPVVSAAKLPAGAPRIALVIGGMGLSQNATRAALEKFPPAISLAFAPYGPALSAQVSAARDKGHEVILQAPMEAFELTGDTPGPHMLRTSASKADLRSDMHWLMSRFPGYIGIGNFLGAKFLADSTAVAALVEESNARGLMLFDDGSSPQSLLPKIAAAAAAPYAQADIVLDADRQGAAIEKELLRLESLAREKGSAIGTAAGLPEVAERIGRFANGLERRGIALVPVSALLVRSARPAARITVSP